MSAIKSKLLRKGRVHGNEKVEHPIGFSGHYATFADAKTASTGYESPAVLESNLQKTLAIEPGSKLATLDARLLNALQYVVRQQGPLDVLDFGGAMGNHYIKLRRFLDISRWHVVELPATAKIAQERMGNDVLSFSSDISGAPNTIVTSGAIQYTEDPLLTLASLQALNPRFLVIDRMPILDQRRLTVQRVPPDYYDASYPAWFVGPEFLQHFEGWSLVMEWDLPDHAAWLDGKPVYCYRGFMFERR